MSENKANTREAELRNRERKEGVEGRGEREREREREREGERSDDIASVPSGVPEI